MRRILWALLLLASPSWGVQRARVPKIPSVSLPPLAASAVPRLPEAFKLPPIAAPKVQALPGLKIMGQTAFQAADRPPLQAFAKAGEDWDHQERREEAREEELVHVNREAKKEAVLHQHAERPALDHSRQAFSAARAKEFAETVYDLGDEKGTTGQDILSWLTTEHAVMDERVPESDFESFGRSEIQVRSIAKEKGVSVHALQRVMDRAFRWGLLYRLYDLKQGKTYYGVPYEARTALNIIPPEAASRLQAEKEAVASEFAQALTALARESLSLKPKDEVFEFVAQTVKAAKSAGIVKDADLPEAFLARAKALDLDASDLRSALFTLLESSHGTPWFDKAKALCAQAASQGLVGQSELDRILADL